MERLNSRKILKIMAVALDTMSKDQLEWLKNKTLERLRDESIAEIHSPYIRNWSFQAQRGHISAYIRKAIDAEEKLNGPKAAERLKEKLYPYGRYTKLTQEQKDDRMNDYACITSALECCYIDGRMPVPKSKWQARSVFRNGKVSENEG